MAKQAKPKVQPPFTVTIKNTQHNFKNVYEVGMKVETDYTSSYYQSESKITGTVRIRFCRRDLPSAGKPGSWQEIGRLKGVCYYKPIKEGEERHYNYFAPGSDWNWDDERRKPFNEIKEQYEKHTWSRWYSLEFEDFGSGTYGGLRGQFEAAHILDEVYTKAEDYASYRHLEAKYNDGLTSLLFAFTALNVTPLTTKMGEDWTMVLRHSPYFSVDRV